MCQKSVIIKNEFTWWSPKNDPPNLLKTNVVPTPSGQIMVKLSGSGGQESSCGVSTCFLQDNNDNPHIKFT